MNTTAVREALALAAARKRMVTVELRNGTIVNCIPEGAGKPRWFRIGEFVVNQYDIVEVN